VVDFKTGKKNKEKKRKELAHQQGSKKWKGIAANQPTNLISNFIPQKKM